MIYADEWGQCLTTDGDARWIAATTCFLLADQTSSIPSNAWQDWQSLVGDENNSLTAVMGFRNLHDAGWNSSTTAYDPVTGWQGLTDYESPFWARFCRFLDGTVSLPPNPQDRWIGDRALADWGVQCYMEAAWEYYHGLTPGLVGDTPPATWIRMAKPASAVDADARYYLLENKDPQIPEDLLIVREVTQ